MAATHRHHFATARPQSLGKHRGRVMSGNAVQGPQRIVCFTEEGPAALTDGVRRMRAIIRQWAEVQL
jgi:hypothetical protein